VQVAHRNNPLELALPPVQRCIKELCSCRRAPPEPPFVSARELLGTGESFSTLPKTVTYVPGGLHGKQVSKDLQETPGIILGAGGVSLGRRWPAPLGHCRRLQTHLGDRARPVSAWHSLIPPQAGRHGAARGRGGRGRQRAGSHQVLLGRGAGAHLLRAERGHRGALALHGEWLWLPGFRAGWGSLRPRGWEAALEPLCLHPLALLWLQMGGLGWFNTGHQVPSLTLGTAWPSLGLLSQVPSELPSPLLWGCKELPASLQLRVHSPLGLFLEHVPVPLKAHRGRDGSEMQVLSPAKVSLEGCHQSPHPGEHSLLLRVALSALLCSGHAPQSQKGPQMVGPRAISCHVPSRQQAGAEGMVWGVIAVAGAAQGAIRERN